MSTVLGHLARIPIDDIYNVLLNAIFQAEKIKFFIVCVDGQEISYDNLTLLLDLGIEASKFTQHLEEGLGLEVLTHGIA